MVGTLFLHLQCCSYESTLVMSTDQWSSQTFSDGRAHYFYKILSIIYKHAGSYMHLLKGVVCMKMHANSIVKA